jgi:hypothetical protein
VIGDAANRTGIEALMRGQIDVAADQFRKVISAASHQARGVRQPGVCPRAAGRSPRRPDVATDRGAS